MYYSTNRWSIVQLWTQVWVQSIDYTMCKNNNYVQSIDAHLSHWVMFMSCSVWPEKMAKNSYINYCPQARLRLCKVKDQKSWTLHYVHFLTGAGSLSCVFTPQKEFNISFLNVCNQLPLRLLFMKIKKSFILCWHSFSGWGSVYIGYSLAYQGCQYIGHAKQWPIIISIILLTKPKIIDPPMRWIVLGYQFTIRFHTYLHS
jgi:hypothetical protein